MKTLRRGDLGPEVAELQKMIGIPADGIFGTNTQATVAMFQTKNGLFADGIVGAATWEKLGLKKPTSDRDKLLAKFGDPMIDPRPFEINYMMTWFCGKEYPTLPMTKIYCNRLVLPDLKTVFAELCKRQLLHEIKTYGGCWNPRYIRGYEAQKIHSIHTWAAAWDFNTLQNPLGMTKEAARSLGLNPFSEAFDQAWRDCGFVCGIDFKRGDGMHYQNTKPLIA